MAPLCVSVSWGGSKDAGRGVLDLIRSALEGAGYKVGEESGEQLVEEGSKSIVLSSGHFSDSSDIKRRTSPQYVENLEREVQEKDAELDDLESNLETALHSIKTFHVQQKELFEEFVALREKYDLQKKRLQTSMWAKRPLAEHIPELCEDVTETADGVAEYSFGQQLGAGQFGRVLTCRKVQGERSPSPVTDQSSLRGRLAVKIIDKSKVAEPKDIQRIDSEIRTLKTISHRNIVRLNKVVHTRDFLYLVTERGGDDLFEYMSKRRNCEMLHESSVHTVMKQLIPAVSFLHRNGICHRDLKPENILLDIREHLLIIDFGLAEYIGTDSSETGQKMLSDFCGR